MYKLPEFASVVRAGPGERVAKVGFWKWRRVIEPSVVYITCVVGALVGNVKSQRVSGCNVRQKHLRKLEQTHWASCLWFIQVRFLSLNNSAPSCTRFYPVAYIALVKTKANLKGARHQNSLATFTLPTGMWRFVVLQGSHTTCPVQYIGLYLVLGTPRGTSRVSFYVLSLGKHLHNILIGTWPVKDRQKPRKKDIID